MRTKNEIMKERRQIVAQSEKIFDAVTNDNRELTGEERSILETNTESLKALNMEQTTIDLRAEKSADLMGRLTSGTNPDDHDDLPVEARRDGFKGRRTWAKSVAQGMHAAGAGLGVKALLTGEVSTPPTVEVAALPSVPTRLLDLIQREQLAEHTFSYLRQVAKEHAAGVVPDNTEKSTSTYTFKEIEDRARVIAHLSEPFPIRYATDHASMVQLLDGQMLAGVEEAIERLIVSGTGEGEEWTGILNTTGVLEVAFSTDMVTTLRKARTALENTGQPVTAVAMNPTDIEALDLLREEGSTGGFLLDTDAYERIFGQGVKGVASLAVPQGQAIAGNWDAVRLKVREGAHTLAATQAGDLFDKNQMKLRSEGRFGFKFTQPGALAVVDLAAA